MRERRAEQIAQVSKTPLDEEEDGEAGRRAEGVVLVDLGQLGEEPGEDREGAEGLGEEG